MTNSKSMSAAPMGCDLGMEKDAMSGKVLNGKTALITGGSSGMGKASAGLLAQDGAHVGSAGIRVNAVRPGMTRSEATGPMFQDEAPVKAFADMIPLGRVGESGDLARVVRFFAGPESVWVTGQVLAADGGQMLKGFRTRPECSS